MTKVDEFIGQAINLSDQIDRATKALKLPHDAQENIENGVIEPLSNLSAQQGTKKWAEICSAACNTIEYTVQATQLSEKQTETLEGISSQIASFSHNATKELGETEEKTNNTRQTSLREF